MISLRTDPLGFNDDQVKPSTDLTIIPPDPTAIYLLLPNAIPYVHSYYKRTWGFCLPYNEFKKLEQGE